MGLYVMALYGGQIAAVPAGFIANTQGWPWVLWWCAILNAIGFIVCFFLMEETLYHRDELPMSSIPASATAVSTDDAKALNGSKMEADSDGATEQVSTPMHGVSYPVRSYWEKLMPFVPLNGRRNTFWEQTYKPLLLTRFPGIVFGGFIYGCFLNWFSIVNATVSIFLTSEPYNWSDAVRHLLLYPLSCGWNVRCRFTRSLISLERWALVHCRAHRYLYIWLCCWSPCRPA